MNTAELLAKPETSDWSQGEPANQTSPVAPTPSLRECIDMAVSNYFKHLDGHEVTDVYDMVMAEVEAPMLEVVMKYSRHNQTKAAHILGLNRGTLRKKLKQYGLL